MSGVWGSGCCQTNKQKQISFGNDNKQLSTLL